MKHATSLGASLLLATALSACKEPPPPCPTCPPPPPPPPAVDTKAEADAITALDARMVEAVAAKDVDKLVGFYSSDASMLPPNGDEQTGEALKKGWADLVAMPGVSLTFAPTRVEVDKDGEMAIDVGTYQLSYDDGKGGKIEDHGKYVEVWEKKGSEWKLAVDMYNTSVPLAAAAAPAAAAKKK
jgi:uncharacterized protein (TIGR02246 family)